MDIKNDIIVKPMPLQGMNFDAIKGDTVMAAALFLTSLRDVTEDLLSGGAGKKGDIRYG